MHTAKPETTNSAGTLPLRGLGSIRHDTKQTEDQWADHFDLVKGLASSRHDPDKKEMTALQYYDLFQGSYVHKPVRHTSKHDDLWQQLAKKHKCNPKLGHCFVCEADEEEGAEGEDSEEEDPNYDPKDN